MAEDIIRQIVEDEEKLFLILGVGLFALLGVMSMITKTFTAIAAERTKREIAAYIAEGTMSPEQGERLVKAGKRSMSSWCG
tara:strand:+ start:596 stop:838 length:243 start_codon:yes stop_codon:yes gene_type:complete